ncbi:GNAT family N-acetyltransferase [Marinicrinis sediminis]|uniref:GNAT family N-acetyltransferase n=1 Tax=Marinicrinis sediminis TaxID=1652465 RepID=A0ABW5RDE7_9BACL
MAEMSHVRQIHDEEWPQLMDLYEQMHPEDPVLSSNELQPLLQQIQEDDYHYLFGAFVEDKLVATCVLVIIPNLTRGGKPYGLIENVVTDARFRRQDLATRVLKIALETAWQQQCYKVMLMTGAQEAGTLQFYEQAGFACGVKTGLIAKP